MTEKVDIKGDVVSYSGMCEHSSAIIVSVPDQGLMSVPVEDTSKYKINQRLKVTITIETVDGQA